MSKARATPTIHSAHDNAGQLKTANYGWTTRNFTYNWDDAGNRTSVIDGNIYKTHFTNALNQYTSAGGDAVSNGSVHEIAAYKSVTYKYYGDTWLSSVLGGGNTYNLYYDALGRCVERKLITGTSTTTNYYLYDGEHWTVEYDGAGAVRSTTIYGNGIDEVIRGYGGGQYPLPDRNGNTAVVTGNIVNGAAEVKEQYRYDAFGAPTIKNAAAQCSTSAIGNRFCSRDGHT